MHRGTAGPTGKPCSRWSSTDALSLCSSQYRFACLFVFLMFYLCPKMVAKINLIFKWLIIKPLRFFKFNEFIEKINVIYWKSFVFLSLYSLFVQKKSCDLREKPVTFVARWDKSFKRAMCKAFHGVTNFFTRDVIVKKICYNPGTQKSICYSFRFCYKICYSFFII